MSAPTAYPHVRNSEIDALLYMRRDSDVAAYLSISVERVAKRRAVYRAKPRRDAA